MDAIQERARGCLRLGLGNAAHRHWCERAVLQHGQMWKQVEILEYHADLTADSVDTAHAGMHPRAVDHDIALLMFLELVEATNQRRFSGDRRTRDDYPIASLFRQLNICQHLDVNQDLVYA